MLPVESPESSSPIVTRAVAAGLQGRYIDNYEFPGWQKSLLLALGHLPQGAARFAISRFQMLSGLPPNVLRNFSIDGLLRRRLDDYSSLPGSFPAIVIGAALGGATAYLSTALGGPFLPQAFVVTLKGGSPDGNVERYLQRSIEIAIEIAAGHPGLMTIQHYDPVHDGWLTRFVNHLRFKLIDLPQAYAGFIRQKLAPGGTVVFLDGGARWLRYRLAPRSVFQVGGWGGIPAEEFLEGSPRLEAYAFKVGLKFNRWKLEGYPLEQGPESEWGTEPGLYAALEAFCQAEKIKLVKIHLPHPNHFSRLAFAAAQKLLEKEGRGPSGVLIEMFSQFDGHAARQAGLLPLWLVFNTTDSLDYLREMRSRFPDHKPVFFSPLATFSHTPDMVEWDQWSAALDGLEWTNIGTRPSHYPADARALVRWAGPLRDWVADHTQPIQSHLTPDELVHLAGNIS